MRTAVKHFMGIGSFAFGVVGVLKPPLLGRMTNASDDGRNVVASDL